MAAAGTVKVDIEVTGYWQRCPVCEGRGIVPHGFYLHPAGQGFMSASTELSRCRRCHGEGTITTPAVDAWNQERSPDA